MPSSYRYQRNAEAIPADTGGLRSVEAPSNSNTISVDVLHVISARC